MNRYLVTILALLITSTVSAIPVIGKFSLSNTDPLSGNFIVPDYNAATAFTATIVLERSLNTASIMDLENVEATLRIVFSPSSSVSDPSNIDLATPLSISAANFGSTYMYTANIGASLPAMTGGGRVMAILSAYYYLNGVRQSVPTVGYATDQFFVAPPLSSNAIRIVPNVRTIADPLRDAGVSSKSCGACPITYTPHKYECPANTVMTGRRGYDGASTVGRLSYYEFSTLKAIDGAGNNLGGTITVENRFWGSFQLTNGASMTSPVGYVITGRERKVTGGTDSVRLQFGIVKYNGNPTIVYHYPANNITRSEPNINLNATDANSVYVRIQHVGNSITSSTYTPGIIYFDEGTATVTISAPPAISATPDLLIPEGNKAVSDNIFPNPTRGLVYFTSKEPLNKAVVSVIDAAGSTFLQKIVSGNTTEIDLFSVRPGIYFIKIQKANGQSVTRKVIKQ